MKSIRFRHIPLVLSLALLLVLFSCRPTRMVPENKQLLRKQQVSGDVGSIDKDDLEIFLRQKPNKKMLGLVRFRLLLYNMAKGGGDSKRSQWMATKAGEAPVLYDSVLARTQRKKMEEYMHNRGYYNATVNIKTKPPIDGKKKKKHVKVIYKVDAGTPYRVRANMVNIADSSLLKIVASNMKESHILPGRIFDIEMLRKEQERIIALFKEEGYYSFSDQDLYFEADTTIGYKYTDIYLHVPNKTIDGQEVLHKKYYTRYTYVIPRYDFKKFAEDKSEFLKEADSVAFTDSVFFLTHGKPYIKPQTIIRANYIENGGVYKTSDVTATRKKLVSNKLFKLVRLQFEEIKHLENDTAGFLDTYIMLTPFTFQSYSVDLEASSTSGDYGAKIQLSYNHKNVFKGSENFSLNLTHSRKLIKTLETDDENALTVFNSQEYSVDTKIETPQFISPFKLEQFQKNQSPHTILKAGYTYKRNLNYISPQTFLSYGFSWKKNDNLKFIFTPSEISGVRYFQMDSLFREYINSNPYYKSSYENYLITATNYTVLYKTGQKYALSNYSLHKFSSETAGNLFNAIIETTEDQIEGAELGLLDEKQTQYLKFDYDFRFYAIHDKNTQTVFRLLAGVAYPYGPRQALPNIKQYTAGGLSSMRAWPARTLGPGSYNQLKEQETIEYYLGDIKFETNLEHRFHMFWHIDGALFLDIGNIWTFHPDETREGTQFNLTTFYKDLAIGAGAGIRFDFSFFVFRVDTGFKLRDPALIETDEWVYKNGIGEDEWNVNIGIGYPF